MVLQYAKNGEVIIDTREEIFAELSNELNLLSIYNIYVNVRLYFMRVTHDSIIDTDN